MLTIRYHWKKSHNAYYCNIPHPTMLGKIKQVRLGTTEEEAKKRD
jgi:hypothetical protein